MNREIDQAIASEPTACDRLVWRLVSYGQPKGVCGRLGMGMFMLRRVYEGHLLGEATRQLPVDGIKEELVADGQAGEFYRHLYFHIGCRFLGWVGMLPSWLMHQVDMKQAAAGRMESAVEVKDNVAVRSRAPRFCWTGRGGEYRGGKRRSGCKKSWRNELAA